MRKVPKLRFREFSDEWEEKRLGNLITIKSGESPNNLVSENGTIPYFKVEQLNNSTKYQIETPYKILYNDKKLVKKGSIIFPKRGAAILLNKIRIIAQDSFMDTNLMTLTCNSNIYNEFLYYVILKEDLSKIADTTSIPQINNKHIEPFVIKVPLLQEQEKIANFLSSIDKKISLTEEKLELFREYKKGAMQKIFSQELRFKDSEGNDYPEWEEKKLGEVFERIIEKNVENNTNVLTISAQYGLISQVDFFNKSVAGKDLSKYYLLQKGDFAYNKSYSNGYPMGAIKKLKFYEKGIVSTLYICFRLKNKKYSTNYFEQYFESKKIDKNIQEIAQEGARNHGLLNISVQDFFNIYIPFPLLEEQQKIADFLSSIDSKIENIEKELEGLKEFKKGLLQQMFV